MQFKRNWCKEPQMCSVESEHQNYLGEPELFGCTRTIWVVQRYLGTPELFGSTRIIWAHQNYLGAPKLFECTRIIWVLQNYLGAPELFGCTRTEMKTQCLAALRVAKRSGVLEMVFMISYIISYIRGIVSQQNEQCMVLIDVVTRNICGDGISDNIW